MGFLTLKVRAPGGGLAYETDFTVQELIPLVRHITRRLERQPELAARLPGYRAVITPGYDRPAAPPAPAAADAAKVSFAAEVQAFFSPGTSPLCAACPERGRCPGARIGATAAGLDGWIVLDPEAPRTNRAIRHLVVHIETAGGERLHREEVGLEPLQPFVSMASALLRRHGKLSQPARGRHRAEVIARHDGCPVFDPLLGPVERARLQVEFLNLPAALGEIQAPPETLVDWDSVEQDEPEIQLLATESETLPPRTPPDAGGCEAIGGDGRDDLLVYVHRPVLVALRAASRLEEAEIEGLLTGQAFLIPQLGRPWIEITGMVPAAAPRETAPGESHTGAFDLLRHHGLPRAGGEERRTVGWFRSHLVGDVNVARRDGRRLVLSVGKDRLAPTRNERFFHRHFFAEPWHVGLIVDGQGEGARFFRRLGEDLVACAGYLLLD
jgi:hypothetical protein